MIEQSISIRDWTGELVKLHHLLQFAMNDFRNKRGSERRPAINVLLHGLSEFVGNVFPIDQEFRAPLRELRYALGDLDRGQVVDLLEAATIGNRPPDPLMKTFFMVSAAALMSCYQRSGMRLEPAARHAAGRLNELGYRDEDGNRITFTKMKYWKNRVKELQRKNDIGANSCAAILSDLKTASPDDAKKAAQLLLAVLPDMIAPGIPTNPSS